MQAGGAPNLNLRHAGMARVGACTEPARTMPGRVFMPARTLAPAVGAIVRAGFTAPRGPGADL